MSNNQPASTSNMRPVQQSEPIDILDILRGFGVFGILAVNMVVIAASVPSLRPVKSVIETKRELPPTAIANSRVGMWRRIELHTATLAAKQCSWRPPHQQHHKHRGIDHQGNGCVDVGKFAVRRAGPDPEKSAMPSVETRAEAAASCRHVSPGSSDSQNDSAVAKKPDRREEPEETRDQCGRPWGERGHQPGADRH